MKIVGEAKNGRQAVELAHALKPDIIIMDLMMPELSGAEATKLIHDAYPEIKIMVLTSFGTSKEMSDAITNGADGALMKDTAADELIKAIRAIVAGERIIPDRLMRQAAEDNVTPKLSDRHLEILSSIAQGQSNSDIAKQYGLSEISIKKQVSKIFARLGVDQEAGVEDIRASRRLKPLRSRRPRPQEADAQVLSSPLDLEQPCVGAVRLKHELL